MSIFIQNNNFYFIKSEYIHIYPCGRRGFVTDNGSIEIDPLARANTEEATTNLYGKLGAGASSYIIKSNLSVESAALEFILNGYFISINAQGEDVTPEDVEILKRSAACFKLNNFRVNARQSTTMLSSLAKNSSGESTGDILDVTLGTGANNTKYFVGIGFCSATSASTKTDISGYLDLSLNNSRLFSDLVGLSTGSGSIANKYFINTVSGDAIEASTATADAKGAIAFGNSNEARAPYSIAFGDNTTTDSDYQVTIGTNNLENENAAFIIGNGVATKTNLFEVEKTGALNLKHGTEQNAINIGSEQNGDSGELNIYGESNAKVFTISKTGATYIADDLTIGDSKMTVGAQTGATAIKGTLDVDGITTLKNPVRVTGGTSYVTVEAPSFKVGANSASDYNFEIGPKAGDGYQIHTNYATKINNTNGLWVTGKSDLNGNVIIGTTGNKSTLTVEGNLSASGNNFTVKEASGTNAAIVETNYATKINNNLTVTGVTSITGNTTITGDLTVNAVDTDNSTHDIFKATGTKTTLDTATFEINSNTNIVGSHDLKIGSINSQGTMIPTITLLGTSGQITANVIHVSGTSLFNGNTGLAGYKTKDKEGTDYRLLVRNLDDTQEGAATLAHIVATGRAQFNGTVKITDNVDIGEKAVTLGSIVAGKVTDGVSIEGTTFKTEEKVGGYIYCHYLETTSDVTVNGNLNVVDKDTCIRGREFKLYTPVETKTDDGKTETKLEATTTIKADGTAEFGTEAQRGNIKAGTYNKVTITADKLTGINKLEVGTGGIVSGGPIQGSKFNVKSDIRHKTAIVDYTCAKSILDLPVKQFEYVNDDNHTKYIGCIAQDLLEICPELVDTDSDGYLSVQESKLVYLLLNEVKQLRNELNALKKGE